MDVVDGSIFGDKSTLARAPGVVDQRRYRKYRLKGGVGKTGTYLTEAEVDGTRQSC